MRRHSVMKFRDSSKWWNWRNQHFSDIWAIFIIFCFWLDLIYPHFKMHKLWNLLKNGLKQHPDMDGWCLYKYSRILTSCNLPNFGGHLLTIFISDTRGPLPPSIADISISILFKIDGYVLFFTRGKKNEASRWYQYQS